MWIGWCEYLEGGMSFLIETIGVPSFGAQKDDCRKLVIARLKILQSLFSSFDARHQPVKAFE